MRSINVYCHTPASASPKLDDVDLRVIPCPLCWLTLKQRLICKRSYGPFPYGQIYGGILSQSSSIITARIREYGFDIYANELEDGRAFTHVCQYLVHYETPPGWRPQTASSEQQVMPETQVEPSAASRTVNTAEVTLRPSEDRNSAKRESLIRLRQMPTYGTEVPSIGNLPQPYLEPQIASIQQLQVNDEISRMTPRVNTPTRHDSNSNYRDQVEFRYAASAWSDTESLDRSMSAMRVNGDDDDSVFTSNEMTKGQVESKEGDKTADNSEREQEGKTGGEVNDDSIGSITGRRMNFADQMKRSQPYMMALLVGKSLTLRSPIGSLSQVSTTNGREQLDSDRNGRYSPFTGDKKINLLQRAFQSCKGLPRVDWDFALT
ncbi:hypothetical protein Aperf_G00000021031 [Anoplocephala perfoliata]